jgi:hypothetical protein
MFRLNPDFALMNLPGIGHMFVLYVLYNRCIFSLDCATKGRLTELRITERLKTEW